MADKPKYWRFTMPNGEKYKAPGETRAEAYQALEAQIGDIVYQKHQHLPFGQKLAKAPDAFMRIMSDSAFGLGDRLASLMPGSKGLEAEKYETQKARMESGPGGGLTGLGGGLPLDIAGAIATAPLLPTAVPRVVRAIGGPKDVQFLTGLGTAAAETAGYGAAEAAARGDDVGQGAALGGLFGAGGHTIAKGLSAIPGAARFLKEKFGVDIPTGAYSRSGARVTPRVMPEDFRPFNIPGDTPNVGVKIGPMANLPEQGPTATLPGSLEGIRPRPPEPPVELPEAPVAPPVAPPAPPIGVLAQAAPPMPPVADPVVAPVPAGPLAAPKEPKRLVDARAGLKRSTAALADVEKELADPKTGVAKLAKLGHTKAALTKSVDRHTKTIADLSAAPAVSPKVAEDTALEAAGAATPPVAPAAPTGLLNIKNPVIEIEDQIRAINADLASGRKIPTNERAAMGREMKELREQLAVARTANAPEEVVTSARSGDPIQVAEAAHSAAEAKAKKAIENVRNKANAGAPATAQAFARDQLDEAAKALQKAKDNLTAAKGEDPVTPRKATAGILSADNAPEPNQPKLNKTKPGTKPISTKEPDFAAAKGPKGASRADRAKAREQKAQKPQPTPEELRAAAEAKVATAIENARIHAAGPNSAGFDRAIGSEIETLLKDKSVMDHLSAEEVAALHRVNKGDPSTRIARFVGHLASIPSVVSSGGLGGAALAYGMNPLLGAASFPGIPLLGQYGRSVARRGAKKLTKELTDLIQKKTPRGPAVDPKRTQDIYKILRNMGL